MMKRSLLLLIFLSIISLSVSAQSTTKQWTLLECVNTALDNNLRVKRSLYSLENAKINLQQAKFAFLPSVNVSGSYGQNYGRAINPVTNAYINRNSNTVNVGGSSSITLFNGFRIQNTFRQYQQEYDATGYDLEKSKNDVIIMVVTYYTNVIFNKELYDNAKYQLNSSQQQLERIKKQVTAGSLPKANEYNQEATVATNEVNLINQENALNLSMLQLKQAMQLPASTEMDVVVPELAVADLLLDQSPEEIYEVAKQSMPEIRSSVLKVQSSRLALLASKGNLYPRLSFNANAQSNYSSISNAPRTMISGIELGNTPIGQTGNTADPVYAFQPVYTVIANSYPVQEQLKDNLFKMLNLQLIIPLFNGYQSRAAVQRAAVSNELAMITNTETENTLRQSIESAYNDAVAAAKTYTASLKQVSAREEAYRMNQQRFEFGAISIVEYQISENDLFQAKTDLSRAKYNFIFKKKILDFYQGKKIEF